MELVLDALSERVFQMIPNLIVPTLNQYEKLQRMVSGIDYPVEHLLIIDNGGRLNDVFIPSLVQKLTILNMPSNLGVSTSWNLGIKCLNFFNPNFFLFFRVFSLFMNKFVILI